jgi:hypothetical protein
MLVSPRSTAYVLRDTAAFDCVVVAGPRDSVVGLVTLHRKLLMKQL